MSARMLILRVEGENKNVEIRYPISQLPEEGQVGMVLALTVRMLEAALNGELKIEHVIKQKP